MAEKMSKPRAVKLLGELFKAQRQQTLLTRARDERLKPLADKYKKACEPINAEYAETLGNLATEIASKQKEVSDFLQLGFDELKGTTSLSSIESDADEGKALMAVVNVDSKRVIPPETFFNRVTERTVEFWGVVNIGIAKASKLVGAKLVDELAKVTHTASVSFKVIDVKPSAAQVQSAPKAKAAKAK